METERSQMSESPSPASASTPADGLDTDRALKQAMRLHEKGRLDQAEKRYAKILQANPEHAGALHLMGVLAQQADRPDDAKRLILQSIDLDPHFTDAYFNLGLVETSLGNDAAAETAYRKAVELEPKSLSAWMNLGIAYYKAEKFAAALDCFDKILAMSPAHAMAHKNRSRTLRELRRFDEALEAVSRAVELRPDDSLLQLELANALRDEDRFAEAVVHYEEALRQEPNMLAALCNISRPLREIGRLEESQTMLERALEVDPDCPETYINLANLAFEREDHQEAVDLVEKTLTLRPDYAEAYNVLGRVLGAEAMNEDAIAAFQKAVEISPDFAEGYVNLGSILQTIGQPERALQVYEIALSLKPKMDMAYWNLALALLSCGRLEEGWSLFGYGFTSKQRQPYRPFPGLLWEGGDLTNKTMLAWREQGLGDDLRFSTVYHDLVEKAGHLIIETDPRLVPLYQRTWPEATVRAETNTSTGLGNMPNVDFDVTAPAGMAASYLRRSLDAFPKAPKPLTPDPERKQACLDWLASLGPGPKVGIAWRSRLMTKTRALYHTDLMDWAELLNTPGVVFVNLQYDKAEAEIIDAKKKLGVTVHQMPDLDLFNDLDGAAALTAALDLVVTSPTSVADMAGALHRPTYTYAMSQHPMALGTDTMPWFPDMKLYTTISKGDHSDLVAQMTRDVQIHLSSFKD